MKLKRKYLTNGKYINTPKFNELTTENFAARLTEAKLATKNGIADLIKGIDFNEKLKKKKKLTSNKPKNVDAE